MRSRTTVIEHAQVLLDDIIARGEAIESLPIAKAERSRLDRLATAAATSVEHCTRHVVNFIDAFESVVGPPRPPSPRRSSRAPSSSSRNVVLAFRPRKRP